MATPLLDVRPVILEGAHVRLEPMEVSHLEALMDAGGPEEIWRYLPVRPQTRDDFGRWIAAALAGREAGTELPFVTVERASGEVVGSTRFLAIAPRDRRLEIGWTWLHPRAQRTAINTEAKYLQLRHCFEELGCLRVELKTDARNEKSRNAMLRIGAAYEGTFRKYSLTQHDFQRDTAWFSIIDDDWPDVKQRLESMLYGGSR